jgi:hypothetical protein
MRWLLLSLLFLLTTTTTATLCTPTDEALSLQIEATKNLLPLILNSQNFPKTRNALKE